MELNLRSRCLPLAMLLGTAVVLLMSSAARAVDPTRALPAAEESLPPAVFRVRLERVARELTRLGLSPAISNPSASVLPLIADARLQSTNVYSPEGIRYLSLRLILLNQSDQPRTLDVSRVALTADGQALSARNVADELKGFVIDVAGRQASIADSIPPATLTIPAGQTAALPLVFAAIVSRSATPAMTLTYEADGSEVRLDLNRFHRGMLELETLRVGPHGACLVEMIGGTLDSINAVDLADSMQQATHTGVRRAVVAWKPRAVAPAPLLAGWLASAGDSNDLYNRLPPLPTEFQGLHLAAIPEGTDRDALSDGEVIVHGTVESAITAALSAAYLHLPRSAILSELRIGHPLARAAAIRFGAERLERSDLPVLISFLGDPSSEIQQATCDALAGFDDAVARQALADVIRHGQPEAATAAFNALASSRFARSAEAAAELLPEITTIPESRLMQILARHVQPGFRERILRAAAADEPQTRIAAIAALGAFRDGHSRLVLERALADADADVRKSAFSVLAAELAVGDIASREVTIQEAIRRLTADPNDEQARSVVQATRDARALPVLIAEMRRPSTDRSDVIDLVGQIGGSTAVDALLKGFSQFNPSERVEALWAIARHDSRAAMPLAIECLSASSSELLKVAIQILKDEGSDQSVRLLAKGLSERPNEGFQFADALATIRSPAAIDALRDLRDHDAPAARPYADWALLRIWQASPAAEAVATAHQLLDLQQPTPEVAAAAAVSMYDAAQAIDPQLPAIYTGRGDARLHQQNWKEAIRDFNAALELNPDEHVALTGLAIAWVMQGDDERAVRWISEIATQFETDPIFFYNSACVYSRALEQKLTAPPTGERDRQIDEYRRRAFESLAAAIEHGFEQPDLMRSDPDLQALQSDPQFEQMVKRATTE